MNFDSLPRWFLWCLALPLIVLNGWVVLKLFEYFQSFFTIAIAATLVSFILSYPANWLQRSLTRTQAVGIVLLSVLVIIAIAAVTLFPLLFGQLSDLASRLPDWISNSSSELEGLQSWAAKRQLPIDISATITQLESRLSTQLQAFSGLIIGALPEAVANILDIFLTLVLSIYLLLHGEQVWQSLCRYRRASGYRWRFLGAFTAILLVRRRWR